MTVAGTTHARVRAVPTSLFAIGKLKVDPPSTDSNSWKRFRWLLPFGSFAVQLILTVWPTCSTSPPLGAVNATVILGGTAGVVPGTKNTVPALKRVAGLATLLNGAPISKSPAPS